MDALNWAVVANGKGSNGNQIVAINRIVSHPFATKVRGFHQNDIALIELTHNLEFDELVQPICLGDKVPEQGDMCIIAGVIKKGEGKKIYFYFLSILAVPCNVDVLKHADFPTSATSVKKVNTYQF